MHRDESHPLCCDCDACAGYACEPDESARRDAQHHIARPRTERRSEARRLLLDDLERVPDDRRNKPKRIGPVQQRPGSLLALTEAELDALERRAS